MRAKVGHLEIAADIAQEERQDIADVIGDVLGAVPHTADGLLQSVSHLEHRELDAQVVIIETAFPILPLVPIGRPVAGIELVRHWHPKPLILRRSTQPNCAPFNPSLPLRTALLRRYFRDATLRLAWRQALRIVIAPRGGNDS
jgi:hypothetical protein